MNIISAANYRSRRRHFSVSSGIICPASLAPRKFRTGIPWVVIDNKWYYCNQSTVTNQRDGYFYLLRSYKYWSTHELLKHKQPFESTNSNPPNSKTMKFSIASIIVLVAFVSQALGASVMHCKSYFLSFEYNGWPDKHIFKVEDQMYVSVDSWPPNYP